LSIEDIAAEKEGEWFPKVLKQAATVLADRLAVKQDTSIVVSNGGICGEYLRQ
jgi:hypothetical protein